MIQKILIFSAVLAFSIAATVGQNSNANVAPNANVAMPRPGMSPEIPAKSTVRGWVYYTDTGRPVRRASVVLMSEETGDGPGEAGGLTDSEGKFQLKNVRAGTYYAMVNAPGVVSPMAFADFSRIGRGNSEKEVFEGAFSDFEKIVVNGLTDIDIQIPAKRGGAVSGRVTYDDGDIAIGVKVEILRKDGERFIPVIPNFSSIFAMFTGGSNQTDDRGIYRFAGLPRGEYKVKVTENITHSEGVSNQRNDIFSSMFTGGNSLVSTYYPDFFDEDRAQIVTVEPGSEQFEVNVVIPNRNLHRIGGTVVAAKDKTAIKGAVVYLKRKGEDNVSIFSEFGANKQNSSTDDDGKWSFKELPKGTYEVVVEPPAVYSGYTYGNGANYASNYAVNKSDYGSMTNTRPYVPPPPKYAKKVKEITIDDKDVSELILEIGYGATLSGTVSTENSQDMPDAVMIEAMNEIEQATTTESVNNRGGGENPAQIKTANTFKMESVAAGKTTLRVRVADEDYYVKSAIAGGKDLLSEPFELKDGESLVNIQIVLAKNVGTLKGSVLDDNKDPVKNAQFTLIPVDSVKRKNSSFYRNVSANGEGVYNIKAAPVEYAILFNFKKKALGRRPAEFDKWLNESVKHAQKITIKANEVTTLKLTAPKQ